MKILAVTIMLPFVTAPFAVPHHSLCSFSHHADYYLLNYESYFAYIYTGTRNELFYI